MHRYSIGEHMPAPIKEKRKVRADTFLEPDVNALLVRYAQMKEQPRAKIIEKAIKEFLERHKEELEVIQEK